ncbi:hypothetical protein [Nocardia africana]|uniref:Uncharacterized protein n=1 Tax=Nocardia africana TaxID=134964 RepID=A0A378WRY7_9NOCA|nr:hypothetical protein [Nocardia africana]SUA43487.1 Uncharacterised protein [Nocardia africana]
MIRRTLPTALLASVLTAALCAAPAVADDPPPAPVSIAALTAAAEPAADGAHLLGPSRSPTAC